MTSSSAQQPTQDLLETPVLTEDDLHARIGTLVGNALAPQLWIMFFTPLGYQLPLVVPIADPLGGAPTTHQLEAMVNALKGAAIDIAEDPAAVFVIERPGQTTINRVDQHWARRLHTAARSADLPVRATYISLASGTRPLPLTPG